jgi:hypothetical protein
MVVGGPAIRSRSRYATAIITADMNALFLALMLVAKRQSL